jgi:hypothetical protein
MFIFSNSELIQVIRYRYNASAMNRRIELIDIKSKQNRKLDKMLILLALNSISQRMRMSHVTYVCDIDRKKELEDIGFLSDF